jgi:uncharacterized protein YcbX
MTKELTLTQLCIYPIKSLGGIQLTSANVMPKGLQYDRRWMLVDEHGLCMTQRVYPSMALFKTQLSGEHLNITFKNDSIEILLNPPANHQGEQVVIWDDTVTTVEVDAKISTWFSDRLGISCKLVFFPEENARPVDPTYKVNNEHVSLADAYPFLILGESSLQDLNMKLNEPVPMNRFRPNFVVRGSDAYAEDSWRNFSIGNIQFVGVKPCARCVLTTVNQDTAERGTEPLRTLASYRTKNNKVYFGQNLVALNYGEIKVGDKIKIETYQ